MLMWADWVQKLSQLSLGGSKELALKGVFCTVRSYMC